MSPLATTRTALLAAAFAALGLARALAAPAQPLTLEVGETRTLTAPSDIGRVVINKAGLVSAEARSPRQIDLTGVAPGAVEVHLLPRRGSAGADFAVEVSAPGKPAPAALQAELRTRPGLELVEVERSGGGYAVSGPVIDLESSLRLAEAAKARTDAPVADLTTVTGVQMVAVDVRFYAVAANTLQGLGFNFSYLDGGIQGGVLSPNSLRDFSLTPGGLELEAAPSLQGAFNLLLARPQNGALGILSALSNAGLSQVLAQPTLLVRSGEQADFLAGGDVPIPVPQGGASGGAVGIEYRPYGVRLTVAPVVLSDKRILLKLSPEVSELDYANQVVIQGSAIPGFRRRSAATTVELGDGQSFVIAGLTYMSGGQDEAKVPGLGDIPIIGGLFKTSQNTRQRQELIIVATPRLVSPMDHDPLEGVELDTAGPSFGDLLLNRNGAGQRVKAFGLSR
jgi:pilus assembly protein CpaC